MPQRYERRWQLSKERLHLGSLQITPQDGSLVLVDAMQSEHGLGRVEANALKVHVDGPSGSEFNDQTLARDAAGPSTPTLIAPVQKSRATSS